MAINTYFKKFENDLQKHEAYNKPLHWFRVGAYFILLFNLVSIWHDLAVFHQHAINVKAGTSLSIRNLVLWPSLASYVDLVWGFFCGLIIFGMFTSAKPWLGLLIFLVSLNYMVVTSNVVNGSDVILNFYVFVCIFISDDAKKGQISQMVNSAAFYLLVGSLIAVYFVNGYGKILEPSWRNGTFLTDAWNLKYYANPYLIPSWFNNAYIQLLTAWVVMLFELLFPLLLLFKKLRKWLVLVGIIFHIFIGLFLSLISFALVMMLPYVLIYDRKVL